MLGHKATSIDLKRLILYKVCFPTTMELIYKSERKIFGKFKICDSRNETIGNQWGAITIALTNDYKGTFIPAVCQQIRKPRWNKKFLERHKLSKLTQEERKYTDWISSNSN